MKVYDKTEPEINKTDKNTDTVISEKKILRKKIKETLAEYIQNTTIPEIESNKAVDIFLNSPLYADTNTLCIYAAADTEINMNRLITAALYDGKTVSLPRTVPEKNEMDFHVLKPDVPLFRQLQKANYGIYEPDYFLQKIDPRKFPVCTVMIVPGLAFTRRGDRLGHGKGYYDRYIEKIFKYNTGIHLPVALVGTCFDIQIFEKIPVTEYDVPLTHILSPNGLIQCNDL